MLNKYSHIVGPPASILIVDDDRRNRELLEVMLGPEGYAFQSAASGEQALAILAVKPVDLILLDVMMAGLDGFQVLAKVKRDLATQNIPVILCTAQEDRATRMRGLNAGAEDFLTKPVDRAELVARVRTLLRLKAYGEFRQRYNKMTGVLESERLYRSTFEDAPVGIAHVRRDLHWLRVNQRLCDLLGFSKQEMEGSSPGKFSQLDETPSEVEAFTRMFERTLDRYTMDRKRFRRKDGTHLWARVNVSFHRDAEGIFEHFIAFIEHITGDVAPT